jgi:hypothetical protein
MKITLQLKLSRARWTSVAGNAQIRTRNAPPRAEPEWLKGYRIAHSKLFATDLVHTRYMIEKGLMIRTMTLKALFSESNRAASYNCTLPHSVSVLCPTCLLREEIAILPLHPDRNSCKSKDKGHCMPMTVSSLVSTVRSGRYCARVPTCSARQIRRNATAQAENEAAEEVTNLQPVDKVLSARVVFDDDDGTPSAQYLARWKVWSRECAVNLEWIPWVHSKSSFMRPVSIINHRECSVKPDIRKRPHSRCTLEW